MTTSSHMDIANLSIDNAQARASLKSNNFTPPPPGFDAPPSTTNNNTTNNKIATEQSPHRKSPSFNNLAMALGTGLAECMDNSTSDNTNNNNTNTTSTNNLDSMTVDPYARQSRHAVTRLIGTSSFQQSQQEGRGSVPPNLTLGVAGGPTSLTNNGGLGYAPTTTSNTNTNSGVGQQQQQVRFTAAMMAQHHHHGGEKLHLLGQTSTTATTQFLNTEGAAGNVMLQMHSQDGAGTTTHRNNGATTGGGGSGSNMMQSSYNPLTQQQQQGGLTYQQPQSSSSTSNTATNVMMMRNTPNLMTYQGVTVVEPNSARNSPAILPNGGGGFQQQQQQQGGGTNPTNGNGMGGLPILTTQQQQQQQSVGIVGGRASAPPSNLTTGTGRTASVLHSTAVHPNLRAYTASSLQMRVQELHQELGGAGSNNVVGGGNVNIGGTSGNVGVVGGPTPPSSRPTTPGQPQQQQQQQQQQQPVRTIIVTSATPPLHPNTTPRPMVITSPPPPPGHVVVTTGAGGPSNTTATNATSSSSPPVVISPEQREREQIAAQELAPFLKRRDGNGESGDLSIMASGGGGSSSGNGGSNNSKTTNSSSSASSSSRGIAILYASTLNIPDIRSTCEAFGALESFRSDFAESKGVVFATFYDLRSAQMAVVELPKALNKMVPTTVVGSGGGGVLNKAVEVEYCVPLNASSATDESMLFLSNLPGTVDEQDLSRMLSSFGEVRAVHYQANMGGGDNDDDLASYMVEFFDVQDARQALMELEHTNSWGERAGVKVATRSPAKRKQGKELIMLMSNWRQGVAPKQSPSSLGEVNSNASSRTPSPPAPPVTKHSPPPASASLTADTTQTGGHVHHMPPAGTAAHPYYQYSPHQGDMQQQYAAQLVMGPDGHYQYVLVNHAGHYGHPGQMVIDPHHQQLMYAAVDPQYMHMNPQQYHHLQYANAMPGANYGMPLSHDILQQQQPQTQPPTEFIRMPSNAGSRGGENNSSSLSSGSSPGAARSKATRTLSGKSNASIGSGGSSSANNSGGNAEENNDLALFIENVKNGKDIRSSLMVRNIPNKYTQQMLLGEFAAAGHGPDKMDFFYLPIDFKNKCNRGYAFVNFVDYKDIVPFFDEYNGTSWKRFNSDKICDITYARIQGKAAMLKRFENSALMAKDDEYRPMVFVSHGERKGQRECFG